MTVERAQYSILMGKIKTIRGNITKITELSEGNGCYIKTKKCQ